MKQSEIWLVNLDPTVDSEIKKTRPVGIVNDDTLGKLPLKVIVPFTDWKEHYSIAEWWLKLRQIILIVLQKRQRQIVFKYVPYHKNVL